MNVLTTPQRGSLLTPERKPSALVARLRRTITERGATLRERAMASARDTVQPLTGQLIRSGSQANSTQPEGALALPLSRVKFAKVAPKSGNSAKIMAVEDCVSATWISASPVSSYRSESPRPLSQRSNSPRPVTPLLPPRIYSPRMPSPRLVPPQSPLSAFDNCGEDVERARAALGSRGTSSSNGEPFQYAFAVPSPRVGSADITSPSPVADIQRRP